MRRLEKVVLTRGRPDAMIPLASSQFRPHPMTPQGIIWWGFFVRGNAEVRPAESQFRQGSIDRQRRVKHTVNAGGAPAILDSGVSQRILAVGVAVAGRSNRICHSSRLPPPSAGMTEKSWNDR